jgi:phospholipase C
VRSLRPFVVCLALGALALAASPVRAGSPLGSLWTSVAPPRSAHPPSKHPGATKLQHLIFIIQENRSFDHYFGTFPGADGFPSPLPCLPSLWHPSQCETPYPNHLASNEGGPYESKYQEGDIDNGLMDGFVEEREMQLAKKCPQGADGRPIDIVDPEDEPDSQKCVVDVMGYHDGTDLPNYWAYAQQNVLQDHFYESIHSWSEPAHLAIFSGWSAVCKKVNPPQINTCAPSTGTNPWNVAKIAVPYLWTDITYMLWQNDITWGVYLDGGLGAPFGHNGVQHIQDVLPGFETVNDDGQVANSELNLQNQFYSDASNGTLPQVTWIMPQYKESEHPTASIALGQTYVTGLINAIMSGPDWNSSAIFVEWDDPAGFYDHEPPPFNFDTLGLGIRLPAFIVSPYAKQGVIDHQICSTDCYLKLIEDVFLNGETMSQAGRPDPRPDYRDTEPQYGDLLNDFNFNQAPRPPMLLSTHPMTLLREDDAAPATPSRRLPHRSH